MIVRMKRLTLVAHKSDESAILSALQAISAVEIIGSADAERDGKKLDEAEATVIRLNEAITALRPYAGKKGFLDPIPETSVDAIQSALPDAVKESASLDGIVKELSHIRSETDKNAQLADQLRPWSDFPADMQTFAKSRHARYFTGLIGAADADKLEELEEDSAYQVFGDGAVRAAVVACPVESAKPIAGFLKSLDWTDTAFPKISGTPKDAIAALEAENRRLLEKREQLLGSLAAKSSVMPSLEGAYDAAVIERDRLRAQKCLAETAATFEMEGWAREDCEEAIEKAILTVTDAYALSFREPAEDEVPPSVVRNNNFVTPFEQITNLYSRPDPKGIDATPYMAPFYILLFGLMLSDSGYGILLSLFCWLYVKIKKPGGMFGGIVRVLFWGGLSTVVWGVLVGTFFGMDFDTLLGTKDIFPLLVDPMTDPISMLILCFGLGLLHILFGMALKMKMAFSEGDWQTAIFDNLSWFFIIFGLIMLVLPATKTVGIVMAIAGALTILLFKGRAKKNPFSRTISGLGELYQITSYLSDVLSYARLFALGIATGVIASVFNDLCSMLMGSPNIILKILGVIVACALLVALHLFNIAINTLGAFVHCARLQYVEFYGKFYEAGGRAFQPLGYKTKNVRITDA